MSARSLARDFKTRRFLRRFVAGFFAVAGAAATLLQLFDVLEPDRISHHSGGVSIGAGAVAFVGGALLAWPRPVDQRYSSPKTRIRVVEDDLFAVSTNVVIGMCDTFDTAVPTIIGASSVQAQFLQLVYGGDVARFDADLDNALAGQTPIESIAKAGKTDRYALGTVATVSHGTRKYFCLPYTTMDQHNVAGGTTDGLWRSLDGLWTAVRQRSNNEPLSIGVIGGGLSRLSPVLPAQDAIRFIAFSFMLASRRSPVCERLDVVVRSSDVDQLDMLELQSFLKSLRKS